MPMYAALAYDAVNVLARALHEVINVGKGSKHDGKLIVNAMKEMEYESKFCDFNSMSGFNALSHEALTAVSIVCFNLFPYQLVIPVLTCNSLSRHSWS